MNEIFLKKNSSLMTDTKKIKEYAERRKRLNGVGTLTEFWNFCEPLSSMARHKSVENDSNGRGSIIEKRTDSLRSLKSDRSRNKLK